MAQPLAKGEKPVHWVGSSKRDLLAFPEPVKDGIGNALGIAQFGGKHPRAKPWKGQGPGIFEAVEDFDGDTFRAVYTVRFREAIYVLHAFQKVAGGREDRKNRRQLDRTAAQDRAE